MDKRALKQAQKIERLQREFSMLPKLEERHDLSEIEEYQHYLLELEEALILFRYFIENPEPVGASGASSKGKVSPESLASEIKEVKSEEVFTDLAQEHKKADHSILIDEPEEQQLPLEESAEPVQDEAPLVETSDEVSVSETEEVPEEVVTEEPVAEDSEASSSAESREQMIDEILAHDDELVSKPSINESQNEETSLADQLARSPIKDLRQAFGLNERFYYANELFNGDGEEFVRALNEFNHLENFNDARRLIDAKYRELYKWDEAEETTQGFMDILERRYL